MKFRPRPYQAEAVAAVIAGHAEHQSVIGRGATGLGKAAILAMLAQHYAQAGRVMVLVDVVRLVHQLADTFEWVTGTRPGIEMGETRAFSGGLGFGDKIVISTFQTQYSGAERNERYRRFKPDDFSCLLVDECLVGETLVRMSDGSNRTIKSIAESGDQCEVASFNEQGQFVQSKPARGIEKSRSTWLCSITCANGSTIECTPEHRVFTQRGYVEARDLLPSDFLLQIAHECETRTTRLRDAFGGRIHVYPDGAGREATSVSANGDQPQLQAERACDGKMDCVCRDGSFCSATRKESRLGVGAFAFRDFDSSGVFRGLQPLLPEWEEGRYAGLARQNWPGRSGVVVYGRRFADERFGGTTDFDGRFFAGGVRVDRELVTLQMGGSGSCDELQKQPFALHSHEEVWGRSLLQNCRAVCDSITPLQVISLSARGLPRMSFRVFATEGWRNLVFAERMSGGGGVQNWPRKVSEKSRPHTRWVAIEATSIYLASKPVYDLVVADNHNFFANGNLVHNCETVFPTDTASRSVVDWYMTNPNIKVFGCTATPFRTDGIAAANLFGHVAFDYDILWGMENGWLVPAKQAMVRVSVDFSTLKIRDTGDGERDYSPEEVASKISDEQTLIEIAKGIIAVAEDRKSIVACPNVATARAVSHYLQGERNGCAQCIFGELGDEVKADIFSAFDRNEFQFLTSVMMLTKGFDQPDIRAVFNCRKTKSKRLYQQLLGRGTRPLKGLLDDLGDATAEARRAAIAASAKPNMLMCNLVGVNEEVRDVTVTDILGSRHEEDVVERAKELQADDEDLEAEAALELAAEQLEVEREAQLVLDEIAQQEADAADDRFEAELRRRADVQAHVEVEYQDDLGAVATVDRAEARIEGPTPKQQQLLAKQVYPEDLAKLSPREQRELARRIVIRMQQGLCSYKQAKILQRNGYTREQTLVMRRDQAKSILDGIFAARGKR